MGSVSENRERMLSEGTHPAQVPGEHMSLHHDKPVHSTAGEGESVVSRVNKLGEEMPIIRPSRYSGGATGYKEVFHQGNFIGGLFQIGNGHYASPPGQPVHGPHDTKHSAINHLLDRHWGYDV